MDGGKRQNREKKSNIEVPDGPIGKKTIYNVLFTRYLNLLNRKKTLSVFIPHGIITYYG